MLRVFVGQRRPMEPDEESSFCVATRLTDNADREAVRRIQSAGVSLSHNTGATGQNHNSKVGSADSRKKSANNRIGISEYFGFPVRKRVRQIWVGRIGYSPGEAASAVGDDSSSRVPTGMTRWRRSIGRSAWVRVGLDLREPLLRVAELLESHAGFLH